MKPSTSPVPMLLASFLALPACDAAHVHDCVALCDDGPCPAACEALRPPADPSTSSPPAGSSAAPEPAPAAAPAEVRPTWLLFGDVALDVACGEPAGPVVAYVGLATACGDWEGASVLAIPLDGEGATYVFEVPDGTWHLMAFADCDGSVARERIAPGAGDVAFTVGDPARQCRRYELAGRGVVELPVALRHVVGACGPR